MFTQGPDRQPRRDRRAGSSARCAAWASRRSRSTPTPTASPARCATPTRRCGSARRRRRRATSTSTRSSPPAATTGARRSIPATASCRRTPASPSGWPSDGIALHRPAPGAAATPSASSTRRASSPRAAACRCCRARGCSPTSTRRWRRPTRIGYPVMLKSTAGGGGIGMQLCRDAADAARALRHRAARRAAPASAMRGSFSSASSRVARHVEVQIFGDGRGGVVALGERDCSLQRRNQKVDRGDPGARACPTRCARELHEAAVALGAARRTTAPPAPSSSSTTPTREEFYFLEVNTRLQVEHRVTEAVSGVDLVEWMVRQAAGELRSPAYAPLAPQRRMRSRCGSTPRIPARGFPAERRAC